jgi:hypothetical protein
MPAEPTAPRAGTGEGSVQGRVCGYCVPRDECAAGRWCMVNTTRIEGRTYRRAGEGWLMWNPWCRGWEDRVLDCDRAALARRPA